MLLFPVMLGAQPYPTAQGNPLHPLPKACWPEALLVGRDTNYAALPCASLDVLPIGMRVQVECTLERLRRGGWSPRVFETVRSDRRQRYLYSYGRTRPGKKVTNVATAATGFHHWGLAVDVIDAKKQWSNPRFFQWLAQHAEACGLVAGAFWKSFPDAPHIQFAAIESMSRAPAWVRRYQREGQRDSLWARLGAGRPAPIAPVTMRR